MKATQALLLEFLQGNKQFSIPIYQRTYSWTAKQCQQLWQDILQAGHDEQRNGHFIGSFVYINDGLYQVSVITQLLIIDGQQRLTTLMLLLHALAQTIEARGVEAQISPAEIVSSYLLNTHRSGDLRYKLLLTQRDRDTFIRIITNAPPPEVPSQRIDENFRYFCKELQALPDLNEAIRGLQKLIIVDISLDRIHDNPQLIFESLNSTGLELSQADLIRNYILMGLQPQQQTDIYTTYWYPMEQRFSRSGDDAVFDRFVRDYLTIRLGHIPNIKQVYAEFKAYVLRHSVVEMPGIVEDIARYARYFAKLALLDEPDTGIRAALEDISTLKVEVAYPFLLQMYATYDEGRLSRDGLLAILRMVETYVFRRAICGIPPNSLNKTFLSLAREIDGERPVERLAAVLRGKSSSQRFPDNEEFKRELKAKDVYHFRNRTYLLEKLENHNHQEPIKIKNLTIEHVMPQTPNLSAPWQQMLGADWQDMQMRYLHTLGNLTLTGYNAEMSDRPFADKQSMPGGFQHSHLQLNQDLASVAKWDAQEIERRAERLATLAVRVWPLPALPEGSGPHLPVTSYTVASHTAKLQADISNTFNSLRGAILSLGLIVREEPRKLYIAYKTSTNFADIEAHKNHLTLFLNMPFAAIHDPNQLCRDVSTIGHWGNGEVEITVKTSTSIPDVMELIRQSFARHTGNYYQPPLQGSTQQIFEELRSHISALDPAIREEPGQSGVIYALDEELAMVTPVPNGLDVAVRQRTDATSSPQNEWLTVHLTASSQLMGVMDLIGHAYTLQIEGDDD